MKPYRVSLWVVISLALVFAVMIGIGLGLALAQGPIPATELSGVEVTPDAIPPSATLAPAEPRKRPDGSALDANSPSEPQSPNLTFSYHYVAGAALHSRDSATGHDYTAAGCVYTTSGTDRILNTHLQVPDGSVLKYLRLFYNDTNATYNVTGYISRYDTGNATNDLVSISSSGSSGIGTSLSQEITHTVDNFGFAYVLIGWPGVNSNTAQVCGLRVAYYAPVSLSGTFMPLIVR